MTQEDLIIVLDDAQEKLFEAIDLLETYVRETNDQNADAYLVDHLKIFASSGNGFLSNDINIDDLKERVLDEVEDEDGEPSGEVTEL